MVRNIVLSLMIAGAWLFCAGCAAPESWLEQAGETFSMGQGARGEEALRVAREELEAREREYGPNHPAVIVALGHLAEAYREREDYEEAERLYRRALETAEKIYWPEHPEVGKVCNNLAVVLDAEGRNVEAERLYKRALRILARSMGLEDPDTLMTLDNLGDFYLREGRYSEAERVLKRLAELYEKTLGPDHPDTQATRSRLTEARRLAVRVGPAQVTEPALEPGDTESPVRW